MNLSLNVEYLDHMGSDLSVVNAARVSFSKESVLDADGHLKPTDTRLIGYLAEHGHWSPFAHAFASFRIKAPVFVARQLVKHQVGLSWNEVSRRYVDDEPELFVPELRAKAASVKQGSSDEIVDLADAQSHGRYPVNEWQPAQLMEAAKGCYESLIKAGVAPEVARAVLPQGTMTEWVWSGSLYAFARVCRQRLDPHAQTETRDVARGISSLMENLFPVSWKVLVPCAHSS